MDPDACYKEMNEALRSGDLLTARIRAEDLKNWIDRGGFFPKNATADGVIATITEILRLTSKS